MKFRVAGIFMILLVADRMAFSLSKLVSDRILTNRGGTADAGADAAVGRLKISNAFS